MSKKAVRSDRSAISITAPRLELSDVEKERMALSKEEQEEIMRDIYGKHNDEKWMQDEKNGVYVAAKLNEFDKTLQNMVESRSSGRNKPDCQAFIQAQESIPDFVNDPNFRVMFLRAERYNVKRAGKRMMKYWKMKVKLFGSELAFLPRHILLSDLSQDDLHSLHKEGFMLLPVRDESQRGLIALTRRNIVFQKRENVGRLFWYVFHAALEEKTNQRNGFVVLVLDDGPWSISENYDRKLDKLMIEVALECLPVRLVGLHHCYDNKLIELILPFLLVMLGKEFRQRFRIHPGGSPRKLQRRLDELATYGISSQILPVKGGGKLEFNVLDWEESRRNKEESNKEKE